MMNVEMIKCVCKGQVVKACKDRVVGKDRTKLSLLKGSFLDPGPDCSFFQFHTCLYVLVVFCPDP